MLKKEKVHILISGTVGSGKGLIKAIIADYLNSKNYKVKNGDEEFSLIVYKKELKDGGK